MFLWFPYPTVSIAWFVFLPVDKHSTRVILIPFHHDLNMALRLASTRLREWMIFRTSALKLIGLSLSRLPEIFPSFPNLATTFVQQGPKWLNVMQLWQSQMPKSKPQQQVWRNFPRITFSKTFHAPKEREYWTHFSTVIFQGQENKTTTQKWHSTTAQFQTAITALEIHLTFTFKEFLSKGVAKGGSWGARDPPFCEPFLTKQPTTGGENVMTISWP